MIRDCRVCGTRFNAATTGLFCSAFCKRANGLARLQKLHDVWRRAGQCGRCGRPTTSHRQCERCLAVKRERERSTIACVSCQRIFTKSGKQRKCCSQQCARERKRWRTRERLRRVRQNDRAPFQKYARQNYQRHREAWNAKARAWHLRHPEVTKAAQAKYARTDKCWLRVVRRQFRGVLPEPSVIDMLRELRQLRHEVNSR